jgi:dUTP pyrophosphatase
MIIKCTQVRDTEPFHVPTQGYSDDAGFDLYISRAVIIHPRTFAQIPSNCALAIPTGYFGLLLGRSSTFVKRHLMCHQGTIDAGYRGEIIGPVFNPMSKKVILYPGERIFQIIFLPLTHNMGTRKFKMVLELPDSERQTHGIGSTGGMA